MGKHLKLGRGEGELGESSGGAKAGRKGWFARGVGKKCKFGRRADVVKYRFGRRRKAEEGMTLKQPVELKMIKFASVGLGAFLLAVLAGSILAPVQTSSAETLAERSSGRVRALVQGANYYLTVSSTGADLDLSTTPDGNITAGADTVTVKTNNPSGYKLYLATSTSGENANKLFLDGDSSNVDTTNSISSITGTFTNPVALTNNTWGYAITKADAEQVLTSQNLTAITDFSESYSTESTNPNSTWAGVPVKGNDQLVKVTSVADESDDSANVNTTIYYGVKATTTLQSGTYKNTILYTAISENAATDSITISPESLETNATDKTVQIETSLVTNISNIDASTVTATIGGQSCTGLTLSNNASTGAVQVTCTAPTLSVGSYTVKVDIPDYGKTFTKENGFSWTTSTKYNLSITFAGSGVNSVQVRTAAGTGGTLVGTVSTSGNSISGLAFDTNYYLYPTFSNGYAINSWNKTSSAGTLASATKFNPTFTASSGDGAVTITGMATPTTMQGVTLAYCDSLSTNTTLTLTDSRDNNTYTVAKLGDNNCWQTQNMRLGATPGALTTPKAFTLTSSNSDVSSSFSVATSDIQNSGTTSWSDTVDAKHIYLTGNATYGNYYNWYTATAGTGLASTAGGVDASSSICPTSGTSGTPWRLPPNTGNGSYTTMFQSSGVVASGTTSGSSQTSVTNAMKAAPYSFPLSGYYYSGVNHQESNGVFWSRTANSANSAYGFYFDSSGNFRLQSYGNKYYGYSVRCVLVAS